MKPPLFSYAAPESIEEALDVLAENGDEAVILAGGQSLMPLLNMRLVRPKVVIDINRVEGSDRLDIGDDGVRVGATVRQREMERAADLRRVNPLLAESLPLIGHFAIRNRGTVCGSLAHADPAAELPAVAMTLGAEFTLVRKGERRVVPAGEFFVGYLTNCRQPDELLSEVRFRARLPGEGWSIQEFARRQGDFALVGVVTCLRMNDGVCEDVDLVTFATGGRPEHMTAVEELVRGEQVNQKLIDRAVEAMRSQLEAGSDIHASAEYRAYVAGTLTGRALTQALERAKS